MSRAYVALVLMLVAADCQEPRTAPESPPPTESPYTEVIVDSGGLRPRLLLDGEGIHVVYFNSGGIYKTGIGLQTGEAYAACAGNCDVPGNWWRTVFDPSNGGDPAAALTSTAIHVVYIDFFNNLRYATCAGHCWQASDWQFTNLGQATGWQVALAADSADRLHLAWQTYNGGYQLNYSQCQAACTLPANWSTASIDTGEDELIPSGIQVDRTGRIHLAFHHLSSGVRYATCDSFCSTSGNWSFVDIDSGGTAPSLALTSTGVVMAWGRATHSIPNLAFCSSACTLQSSWTLDSDGPVGAGGFVGGGAELTASPTGDLYFIGVDSTIQNVAYAKCLEPCGARSSWMSAVLDTTAWGGASWALAVDQGDKPRIAFQGQRGLRMAIFK